MWSIMYFSDVYCIVRPVNLVSENSKIEKEKEKLRLKTQNKNLFQNNLHCDIFFQKKIS